MALNSNCILEKQQAPIVENLLTRSAMYQILSACFLYPTEQNLEVLKNPDFQEHSKNLVRCYEGLDSGEELKRCLDEVHKVYNNNASVETLRRTYSRIVGHTISKECPLYENPVWCSPCVSTGARVGRHTRIL